MFNDLFWALYWIDVLSSLPSWVGGAFSITATVTGVVCGFTTLICHDGGLYSSREEKQAAAATTGRWCKRWVWLGVVMFLFSLILAFVPSKQTMYMMLGVKTTDNIVNSDVGKKVQLIINNEIDGWLKKYENKK